MADPITVGHHDFVSSHARNWWRLKDLLMTPNHALRNK